MNKKPNGDSDTIEVTVVPLEKLQKSQFITSSLCGSGACVGVARLDNLVAVQDMKDPSQRMLTFTKEEWQAFVAGVKNDEFNI